MLLRLLAINHSNARANGVSTFFRFLHCFVKRVLSIVADTYHPSILTIAQPSPKACSRQDLAPRFAERRRCWSGWGQLGTRRNEPRATPPPRSLKTRRKEQEFDPARVSGEHTTGNKRAAAAPSVSTSARERASSCIATAPRRRRTSQKQVMELAVCATPLTPVAAARAAVTLRRMKAKRKTTRRKKLATQPKAKITKEAPILRAQEAAARLEASTSRPLPAVPQQRPTTGAKMLSQTFPPPTKGPVVGRC